MLYIFVLNRFYKLFWVLGLFLCNRKFKIMGKNIGVFVSIILNLFVKFLLLFLLFILNVFLFVEFLLLFLLFFLNVFNVFFDY